MRETERDRDRRKRRCVLYFYRNIRPQGAFVNVFYSSSTAFLSSLHTSQINNIEL